MNNTLRTILLIVASLGLGLAANGATHYLRAYLNDKRRRFFAALALTLAGGAGLCAYVLIGTLERFGEPDISPKLPVGLVSGTALVLGLLGIIVERGRTERAEGRRRRS